MSSNSLLFLHNAKTGGLSVRQAMLQSQQLHSFDCYHNGHLLVFRNGTLASRHKHPAFVSGGYSSAFYVLREPLDRLLSCYRYFCRGGLNQYKPDSSPQDLRWQQFLMRTAPTFEECCRSLESVAEHIPHFRPVSWWLACLPQPLANNTLVARFDAFPGSISKIFLELGDPQLAMMKMPQRNMPVQPEHRPTIDATLQHLVCEYYRQDFELYHQLP